MRVPCEKQSDYSHVKYKCAMHIFVFANETLCIYIHVLMRDGRKKQARSNKQQGKATQHTQGSQKNELPQVGLKPTTLYTLDGALYH